MTDKRYQVFVSSTFRDLVDERREVMHALLEMNCMPAGMELFPAAGAESWELIYSVIDESDYFILIIGGRYGTTDADGVSYTEREYDYAVSAKKPVLVFLHDQPGEIPAKKTEMTDAARVKLDEFREKVRRSYHFKPWKNPDDLGAKVTRSLVSEIRARPAIGWIRADLGKTIQDVEERRLLEHRVHELEDRLRAAEADQTDGPDEAFARDDDRIEIRYGKGKDESLEITWKELFRVLGRACLQRPQANAVQGKLGAYIYGLVNPHDAGNQEYRIQPDVFESIEMQFIALKFITIEGQYTPPASNPTFGSFGGAAYIKTWHLTPDGYRELARLVAQRRHIPSNRDLEAAN
jgi:hypothetical protein